MPDYWRQHSHLARHQELCCRTRCSYTSVVCQVSGYESDQKCKGVLARAVYKNGKQYETIEKLQRAIVREWAAISASCFERLVSSMKNRCIKLIKQAMW
ncbi:TPA: hypothetical protein N0F65_002915 [Lagenidium giganteum]|uniref:Uncharacterized protein n=1 Tax=Lagenidium giganteum TaxID=4803 RepID=A0AAV2Z8T7_9STRA|nr:TPA: hypothetical protein N0F65_002915 [Lagenidium giganteum]